VRLHTLSVLLGLSPVILLVWLAVFFSRLQASSNKQDPRQDGGALEFFLAPGMRILLSLVQFALLAFSVALVVFAPAESSLYASTLPSFRSSGDSSRKAESGNSRSQRNSPEALDQE
jgi:hypothetical protein